MGSLLAMLLLSPKQSGRTKPIVGVLPTQGSSWRKTPPKAPESLTTKAKRAMWAVCGEVVGAALGLLVVVAAVLFFYLFCLPWMGVR
jgi:hypothetical protein